MQYIPVVPTQPPLQGAVELVFALFGYEPEHRVERLVPSGRMTLVFELDGRPRHVYDNETLEPKQECRAAWLSGLHSRYITIGDTSLENRLAAVQFAPDSSHAFTHRPASEFCDRVVPAEEAFGPSVLELREELVGQEPGAVTETLLRWLEGRFDPGRLAPSHLRRVVARLLDDPGSARVTELVDSETEVSYKLFLEQFRRFVGPTPKSLQRILRFSRVFERIQGEERIDWAGLSHELGFSDQGHFIREFSRFSGYRPVEFADQGHDRLNFFPEDSAEL